MRGGRARRIRSRACRNDPPMPWPLPEARYANMLPLLLTADWARAAEEPIWRLNRALSRIPGLRLLATNVEFDRARRAEDKRLHREVGVDSQPDQRNRTRSAASCHPPERLAEEPP